jgi:hypothetical protein
VPSSTERLATADPAPGAGEGGPPDDTAPEAPGRRAGSGIWATALCFGIIAVGFGLPLVGLLRAQGPAMEEGFMLVFPERVLAGDIPNKDFLHLYGPGSLWFLAGVFEVFSVHITVERLAGLAQHVGVVTGMWFLARPWGRPLATVVALVTLVILLPPTGLIALAWIGALAFGVWAVWAALRARGSEPGSRAEGRWATGAGLLAAGALLFRPDLVVASSLGLGAALWGGTRRRWVRFAAGLAIGLSPYLVHLVTAGPWTAFEGMVIEPVFDLRGGRRLPVPPSPTELTGFLQRVSEFGQLHWPLPELTTAMQNALWFWLMFVVAGLLVGTGIMAVRRDPGSVVPRTLLAVGLFGMGLLPQGIQRVDGTHFAWASAVSIGFLPVAISELLRRPVARAAIRNTVAAVAVIALVVLVLPNHTVRRYSDYVGQTFGSQRVIGHRISWEGRTFYYGREDVDQAVAELLPEVERVSEPGDRLFVGPSDLRQTPYSDAFLYYLLPDLPPATHYIEMDPGVADAAGSGLAEDLASADVVILSRVWEAWTEPNDSRIVGSDEPVRVLEERFCQVGAFGERRDGDPTSPTEGDPLYELFVPRDSGNCP